MTWRRGELGIMGSSETFRFGSFRLIPAERELLCGGVPVELGPRAFDLLLALVRRSGRLATKDELMVEVWSRTVVEENNLQAHISALRKVLARDAGGEGYLLTVPGYGYRFVAEVMRDSAPSDAIGEQTPSRSAAPVADEPSLAVLPFQNTSGEAQGLIRTIPRKGLRLTGEVLEEQQPTAGAAMPAALARDATAPTWRGAQRRHVTVLVCDPLGPAALCAQLDPEDLRDAMETCSRRVGEVVERHGGFIAQNTADRILVCFGYPQSGEDDAERAVRTGLAVVQGVTELKPKRLVNQLRPCIGIATGLVVIGDTTSAGATPKPMLVGEPLLRATRLLALADGGGVVISTDTQRLVNGFFECAAAAELALEDLGRPLQAFRVLRENAIVGRFEALRASRSRLIGRTEELDLLLRRWNQASSGDGRVVLVTGEAGIGKSRLIHALQEQLEAEPPLPLRYDCSPHHRDVAFYPIARELLRSAGVAPDDGAEEKVHKLEALLRQSSEDLAECMPLFAALLSIPAGDRYPAPKLTPHCLRERTLAVLLDRVRRLAAKRPVLMVFEDLQWADPTSLELVCRLVDQMPGLPVLVLATFRPGFSAPWPSHRHVSTISLSHLGPSESSALVKDVASAKTLEPEVIAQIVARADGVPLFIEELTKAVIEGGLRHDRREWREAAVLPDRSIPPTLHASLVARLDRLGPAKEVAQIGASMGRDFSYRLIAAVAALPEPDLKTALGRLTEAELIFQRGLPPDATYIFKHALVQDAAYGTLLRSRRQHVHARIAETLEQHFPEIVASQPGLLAQHCAEAGLSEKAVAYWLAAGQQA
jgi:DNA-binding winged helix-turn-helix (wHTH) protein